MNAVARIAGVSFGVPDLDEAYPKLILHGESLQVAVLNHEEGPPVVRLFQYVAVFAIQVFRREEEAMDLCRDPSATVHRTAHQKFLRTLQSLQARFEAEGPSVPLAQDIRYQLVDWLVDHHRLMNAALGRLVGETIERSVQHHQSSGTL